MTSAEEQTLRDEFEMSIHGFKLTRDSGGAYLAQEVETRWLALLHSRAKPKAKESKHE